ESLAVDGNQMLASGSLGGRTRQKGYHPGIERLSELLGLDQIEDPTDRIMRRHTVLEIDVLAEPLLVKLRKQGHLLGTVTSGQCAADGNEEDVLQWVKTSTLHAWITYTGKELKKIGDRGL